MPSESYTPGHSENATEFMAARSMRSHGQFFVPHLPSGASVLDCGCGPGSITFDIAERVAPGQVTGIDFGATQIELAKQIATNKQVQNATFQCADCYRLPFPDESFDRVFSHAMMEHLAEPRRATQEMFRVLKPGGVIGLCSPDWGGFVLAPPSKELTAAIDAYTAIQSENGGDVQVGRKLGLYMKECGLTRIQMAARYECYSSLPMIGEYLALQLEHEKKPVHASTLRQWSREDGGMFAQCWVSCVGHKYDAEQGAAPDRYSAGAP